MNLTLWRGTGTHRAPTRAELAAENARLQQREAAADDFFYRLLADRDSLDQAVELATARYIEAETVVTCQARQIAALEDQVTELTAQIATARSLSLPAGHRVVDLGDEPTEPVGINVIPLRAAFGAASALPVPAQS
ncbi:hypothetical protein ACFXHD_25355 [Streptomyces hydrogenans]|uniref:hypothetical protein n=1 Tax=Streptomyces hydrogenans TaxID=1873719 RepID=UPI0036CE5F04